MTVKGEANDPEIPVATGVPVTPSAKTDAPLVSGGAAATAMPTATPVEEPAAPKTVEVVAPTALQGGYRFNVDAGGGKSFLVEVPAGGVSAGQRFAATVLNEAESGGHDIPHGRWRDDLCDWCTFGCCHPHCCLSLWCTLCGLGQVLHRMKLNAIASPLSTPGISAFKVMMIITVSYWVLNIIFILAQLPNIWGFLIFVIGWFVTAKARAHMRRKYSIPASCCGACDDICCGFWCQPCTVCQMGRHSADYRKYPAACCSDTGLNPGAPEVV